MTDHNIRIGSTMITFYNNTYWGLPEEIGAAGFRDVVMKDPLPYFERMLDGMKEAGVEGIELAPAPGGWEGAKAAYGSAAGLKKALDARGLALGSSYQNGRMLIGEVIDGTVTEEEADAYVDEHARFVAELGADIIVMGTVRRTLFTDGDFDAEVPLEAMELVASHINRLAAVAWKHGVRIALHTDAYSVCTRNRDINKMLELTNPENVWLCLDAGHTTLDGGDAVQALADNIRRVPVMHWKDCYEPMHGTAIVGHPDPHALMIEHFRIFGDGIIDWKAWQRVLADAQWKGWAMAENDMAPDPVAELRQAIKYFNEELASIYK